METNIGEHLGLAARVLLVEDQDIAASFAKVCLESLACHVDWAPTGAAALERLRQDDYDLVLMDIGLPDLMGYEVAKQFRELFPHKTTPIVALTVQKEESHNEHCLMSGLNGVFQKPLTSAKARKILEIYAAQPVPVA